MKFLTLYKERMKTNVKVFMREISMVFYSLVESRITKIHINY